MVWLVLPPLLVAHLTFISCQCNHWFCLHMIKLMSNILFSFWLVQVQHLTLYQKKKVQHLTWWWFISYLTFYCLFFKYSNNLKALTFWSHWSESKQPLVRFLEILSVKHGWLTWWHYDIDDNKCQVLVILWMQFFIYLFYFRC